MMRQPTRTIHVRFDVGCVRYRLTTRNAAFRQVASVARCRGNPTPMYDAQSRAVSGGNTLRSLDSARRLLGALPLGC